MKLKILLASIDFHCFVFQHNPRIDIHKVIPDIFVIMARIISSGKKLK